MTEYPHRVRLHGGRNAHAARDLNTGDRATACDYFLPDEAANHPLPADSPITCGACIRQINRSTRPTP
jgi:hypothetical protein